jgi:hypothetical protein
MVPANISVPHHGLWLDIYIKGIRTHVAGHIKLHAADTHGRCNYAFCVRDYAAIDGASVLLCRRTLAHNHGLDCSAL